jgi:hypothetical protein
LAGLLKVEKWMFCDDLLLKIVCAFEHEEFLLLSLLDLLQILEAMASSQ